MLRCLFGSLAFLDYVGEDPTLSRLPYGASALYGVSSSVVGRLAGIPYLLEIRFGLGSVASMSVSKFGVAVDE